MGLPLNRRDPTPPPQRRGLGLGTAVNLVVGLQLGTIPWRYRKQIWQLQGAALSLVVGYLLGAANRKD